MHLVIVESPSKAKTINKYLGKEYQVVASFGHIRDLSTNTGSVNPQENFALTWDIDSKAQKHIKTITDTAIKADKIILATDPDREGEAISWHVYDILIKNKKLKDKKFERVVFNAITEKSVLEAMKNPREIDDNLVQAYLTRRSLDYLVGYTLSPILWRKLPGARSAGRVQSVALRIICDREHEIEQFISQDYWTIEAILEKSNTAFNARLIEYDNKKLDKLDIKTAEQANDIKQILENSNFIVKNLETKEVNRAPLAPFTTSTLQQAAATQLGFSSKTTMQIAQKLYEGIEINGETSGLITYLRTDGVQMAPEAIDEARTVIKQKYGENYLTPKPRLYTAKAKNAQEAHEAIRPTSFAVDYNMVKKYLSDEQLKLYDLIWKRAIASQMASAKIDRTKIDIEAENSSSVQALLRANGSILRFKGFLSVYKDDKDTADDVELPIVNIGESLYKNEILIKAHSTEPPPRYTEASIIKKLEELGIGRPSTFASILTTLRDRDYIISEKNRLIPQSKGRFVTEFLKHFFEKYVEYNFTANLEEQLDLISDGKLQWKEVLEAFWQHFNENINNTANLRIGDVIDTLNETLYPLLFPEREDGKDARLCPICNSGNLSLKLSKFGAFVGCSNYPDCTYTRQIGTQKNETMPDTEKKDKVLGTDRTSQEDVYLLYGRYGPYVQLGKEKKAKKTAIPKDMNAETITLDQALALLSLPREIGIHPESGEPITTSIGPYGPYILHNKQYTNLKDSAYIFNITLEDAIKTIAEKKNNTKSTKSKTASSVIKTIGEHPTLGEITLNNGRYGPYVKAGKINATVPKDKIPEEITQEEAIELLNVKLKK